MRVDGCGPAYAIGRAAPLQQRTPQSNKAVATSAIMAMRISLLMPASSAGWNNDLRWLDVVMHRCAAVITISTNTVWPNAAF